MLVLAGIELIFFIVASMGLRLDLCWNSFGYTGMFFIIAWAALHRVKAFSALSPHPSSERAGGAQEAGRGHSRDSWPQLTKGIFHVSTSCSAYKARGRRKAGMFGVHGILPPPSNRWEGWSVMDPCFPGDGWTPAPQMGSDEWNSLFCSACVCVLLYLLNPWVFSLLPLWFSPPSHCRGVSEQLCGAWLLAGVKPQHPYKQA